MIYFPCSVHLDFLSSRTAYLTFIIIITLALLAAQIETSSNLVLLTASFRTFQKHACDGEELRLECPSGTVISISLARYGRPNVPSNGPQLCPQEEQHKQRYGSECLAETALPVIEKTCRQQKVCRLWTSPPTFQKDPCPGIRKFAEVAYKCRPDEFKNRVVCEGDRLRLNCEEGNRIVIYSAMFGSVKTGVIECPQPNSIEDEDCSVSYATETVIKVCGGRRKCSLAADVNAFGSPLCTPKVRKHLKVTFTCVPEEVLTAQILGADYEEDDDGDSSDWNSSDYVLGSNTKTRSGTDTARLVTRSPRRPLYGNSTIKKLEMQNDEFSSEEPGEVNRSSQKVVGLIVQWISAKKFIAGNKEKLILYVSVSLGVGLLIFLSVVGIKLFHLRIISRNTEFKSQEQFPDDSSDYEPDERPPSRYSSKTSVRRQDSDVQPRTPVTSDANHYYV